MKQSLSLIALLAGLGLTPLGGDLDPATSLHVELNGESLNKLATNKLGANKLAANKLGLNKLGVNAAGVNHAYGADETPMVAVRAVTLANGARLEVGP
jgi:hypothetical protein